MWDRRVQFVPVAFDPDHKTHQRPSGTQKLSVLKQKPQLTNSDAQLLNGALDDKAKVPVMCSQNTPNFSTTDTRRLPEGTQVPVYMIRPQSDLVR